MNQEDHVFICCALTSGGSNDVKDEVDFDVVYVCDPGVFEFVPSSSVKHAVLAVCLPAVVESLCLQGGRDTRGLSQLHV